MLTRELIDAIALTVPVQKKVIAAVLREMVKVTHDTLARGDAVMMSGLGRFAKGKQGRKVGRNPKTKVAINIPAKWIVKFKPSSKTADSVR